MIYRLFQLQIVNGEAYLANFKLKIKKERTIASTRGCIYDRNGNLLAYNELAYSIIIEDVYETGSNRNKNINETVFELIKIVDAQGDQVISDFNIILDENGNYDFKVSNTKLLRFLADVYGHASIDKLKYAEKTATAEEVIKYMAGSSYFAIGDYTEPGNRKSFKAGLGYTKEDLLKMITIRYAMSANNFQKFIPTTVATDVSQETVAVIMENSQTLTGVSVQEDTIRKYVDSIYFSNIIGYTGRVSQEELDKLLESDPNYLLNDMVGKSGIEYSMELELQGTKGRKTVYVDNLGKVNQTSDQIEPIAGNDLYLTIDKELQEATYHILEQKISGILLDKLENTREYTPKPNATPGSIKIPIYNVYIALFENNIIRLKDLSSATSGQTSKEVYEKYLSRKETVFERLAIELLEGDTPYNKLNNEYKTYESYIVSLLMSDSINVLMDSKIDKNDATYKAWKIEETISLKEFLNYAISMNWIDITKINLDSKYSDSDEIYRQLLNYLFELLDNNNDFAKKIFKYMIKDDSLTGKQIGMILCEEGIVTVSDDKYDELATGKITAYSFMRDRIKNLDITPAQLALDPCAGSIVITDVSTGDVLALVSYPGYDSNRLANSVDADYFNTITNDASNPLWNYATQYRGAPGSTYKMVVAAAALEENIVTPTSTISCLGTFERLTPTIHKCWINPGAHGSISISTAIEKSCNYFFYEIGYRLSLENGIYNSNLGIEQLTKYADLFGLSESTGIEIPELSPLVSTEFPVPSAIGQGNNSYTTIGLARYVATVANSGTCHNLTLLDKLTDSDGNLIEQYEPSVRNILDFKDSTWNSIQLGMKKVVESKYYYNDLGITVAGKTGTAQESSLRPDHALFVGYAPYEKPEIAIVTRIANGYSSDYAAETTRDVIKYYYNLDDTSSIITGTADELDSTGTSRD